ncbi:MAG TPA: hypothetical protein VFV33_21550 [Gemmatimonadaceae bacterium]|nr:hypothetical protein [Gemmatimonadaceae bacterium]
MERWTEDRIVDAIRARAVGGRMPTRRVLGQSLTNAIQRRGGMQAWADRLALVHMHDSKRGWEAEEKIALIAMSKGCAVERRKTAKCPWDLRINGTDVEVKYARGAMISGKLQWTWRIARKEHACPIYVLIADAPSFTKILIVPSEHMPLTCATSRLSRKWVQWLDRWDLLEKK